MSGWRSVILAAQPRETEGHMKPTTCVEEMELDVEELEEVIAPIRVMNHNETLVRDTEEIELEVEELEEVIGYTSPSSGPRIDGLRRA